MAVKHYSKITPKLVAEKFAGKVRQGERGRGNGKGESKEKREGAVA